MSLETEYGLNYNDYIVLARFYPKTNKNELFDKLQNVSETRRLFADVILKGSESDAIGAYIIMINPGSCKPTGEVYKDLLGIYEGERVYISKSDMAQKCVMALMKEIGVTKVRILNLSDIKEPNLISATEKMKNEGTSASIFSPDRAKELATVTKTDAPFIIAWGKDPKLKSLKEQAFLYLKDKEPLGICDNEADLSYRYIKPWKVSSQIEIINALSDQWKERMDAKSFGH